ncbi:hypothetical protein BGW36DRAFT_384000 [Talaromyces proteolyticus]|uniref:Capsule polysaccharide biosynthesis protein n=1 Tax=Talaromyces proteolyticus TaxID=1131652 RepID=A0AAD4KLF1_9EURO|nr:uncharacterized protein BGW36DRAFT_384000 [Talaromyces proteolyticus]KAH8693934.1 hypothetical protein BGW36DRAFT_384000 [Talaromyces proteolyticus]
MSELALSNWLPVDIDTLIQTAKDAVPESITVNGVLVGAGLLFLLLNVKGLPGAWHARLFKGLFTHVVVGRSKTLSPMLDASTGHPRLFSYLITFCSTPLLDCDYNLHKSNSTFFSDVDINRTQLMCSLFKHVISKSWLISKRNKPLLMALGGTSCIFKREIKPLQKFEIWSRVLAWDEKWVYVVSYFVRAGTKKKSKKSVSENGKAAEQPDDNGVLASCIARYVFKDGRITVKPKLALQDCGLIPEESDENNSGPWSKADFEKERVEAIKVAKKFTELEVLPQVFDAADATIMGSYKDL